MGGIKSRKKGGKKKEKLIFVLSVSWGSEAIFAIVQNFPDTQRYEISGAPGKRRKRDGC